MDTATLFAGLAAFAAALSAAGTLTLAYVTYTQTKLSSRSVQLSERNVQHTQESVEQNRRMVEEMKADREAREKPFVVMYLDYSYQPRLYLVIHNIGKTPARKIKFFTEGHLLNDELRKDYVFEDPRGPLPHIESGLEFLGPDSKVLSYWGGIEKVSKLFEQCTFRSKGVDVEVIYEAGDYESVMEASRGNRRYKDVFNINPTVQHDLTPVSNQKRVNDFLSVATEVLARLGGAIDKYKRLKIITPREKQREALREFEAQKREAEEQRNLRDTRDE